MIVTVLGGSASSTPWLIESLRRQRFTAPVTIRLAGRTRGHLATVARACRLLGQGSPIQVESFEEGDWASALSNAKVVLIQIRSGGLEARCFDESFPHRYGIPGDEGLGPGGLAAAVRTWPDLSEILDLIYSCAPDSLPILLTSPGNLLIRAAAAEYPGRPLYGICELPFTTLERLCAGCGARLDEITFSYSGMNHLGWLYKVKCGEHDLVELYSRMPGVALAEVIREYGALPLKYSRLHFEPTQTVREQRRAGPRSRELMTIRRRALLAFEYGGAEEIRQALAARTADWYTAAIGPLIAEVARSEVHDNAATRQPYFISMADLCGEVCERACLFSGGRFAPLPSDEPPPRVREFLDYLLDYERAASCAVLQPDEDRLAHALALHPWVENAQAVTRLSETRGIARGLAREIWNDFESRIHRRNELACLS